MVAPPWFELPPTGYGGVEAVVADLVDELAARGHHVTLIGSGSHRTNAHRFLAVYDVPPSSQLGEPLPEVTHAAKVGELVAGLEADIVHDHSLAGPLLGRGSPVPLVATVHGPVHGQEGEYYRALGDSVRLIAISAAQRALDPSLSWAATVHNGIRVDTFPFCADKEPFALFLGRMHPNKAPHLAIDAARTAGMPVVLAGKCAEPFELAYLEREIKPRLGPDVELLGVADAALKRELLAKASVLLFPICWEEPFGLVMIEAGACGTPVAALRRGSVPEVIDDGVTGVIADDPADLPKALRAATELDPAACRARVEAAFGSARMAAGYEAAYRQVLAARGRRVAVARPRATVSRATTPPPAAVQPTAGSRHPAAARAAAARPDGVPRPTTPRRPAANRAATGGTAPPAAAPTRAATTPQAGAGRGAAGRGATSRGRRSAGRVRGRPG